MTVAKGAPPADPAVGHTHILDLDPVRCREQIGRHEFAVCHALRDHPLFTLEAVTVLAAALPP